MIQYFLVKLSIIEFIQRYSPERIVFTSAKDDGNRTNLYRKMIEKFSKGHGYVINDIEDISDSHHFTLIKEKWK